MSYLNNKNLVEKAISRPKFCGWLPLSNLTSNLQWYTLLQLLDEINVSLQRLLGGNIFTLYFTRTTKIESKKGHNLANFLRIFTNIELDLYFIMICPSANFQWDQYIIAKYIELKKMSTQQKLGRKRAITAKNLLMITNIKLDLYFTMIYVSANV